MSNFKEGRRPHIFRSMMYWYIDWKNPKSYYNSKDIQTSKELFLKYKKLYKAWYC